MKCNFQWLGVEDGERKWRLDCYHGSGADALRCKVDWQRFYRRQQSLRQSLARECDCIGCQKIVRVMEDIDRVTETDDQNETWPGSSAD